MVSREEITQAPRSRSGELSPTLMSGHRLSYKLSGLLVPALGLEEPGPSYQQVREGRTLS